MLTSGRALMLLLQEQETTSRMAAKSIFAGSFYIELAACKTLESKRTTPTTRAAIETPPRQYRHMRDVRTRLAAQTEAGAG